MMTFFDLLTYWGAVEGAAGDAGPASGTRLSTLAIELPRAITPEIAGLAVGSFVGVVGFIAVMLLVGRGHRRPSRRGRAPRAAGSSAFMPSSELSARVFAKMGYQMDEAEAPCSQPMLAVEVEMGGEDELSVFFEAEPSMPAMGPAPIVDLSFDDSPTEIGETYFDEPPQPRRRTDPPRIRRVAPAGPRFPELTRNG